MRSKTDFYRLFFEQLARKGFDVKRSQSSDYIADIYYKNQLVAYFSKADTVIQNPFVAVKDKPCACQKNCAWYNPTAGVCDVSVLSGLLLHEPELLELRDSLDHQCE